MPDLTYKQLQQAVTDLGKDVIRACDAIRTRANLIDEEARDTSHVAEMIAGMKVDASTVAETRELAKIMLGVSDAAIAYAYAGDTTAKAAKATHDQTRTAHGGISEAVSRSRVDGIHNVSPEWFRKD